MIIDFTCFHKDSFPQPPSALHVVAASLKKSGDERPTGI